MGIDGIGDRGCFSVKCFFLIPVNWMKKNEKVRDAYNVIPDGLFCEIIIKTTIDYT